MTLEEIEKILKGKNLKLDSAIQEELVKLKVQAVKNEDEKQANAIWCYEQIFLIQRDYYHAYQIIEEAAVLSNEFDDEGYNTPKSRAYEVAWNDLDHSDINISSLEQNFCIPDAELNDFHIVDIEEDIKKLFPLFPYRVFTSREVIIKKEECSICGKTISVRHPACDHVVGKLYMGEMCCRKVIDFQFINVNIVSKPFDRYAIMKLQGIKFNFDLLDFIADKIRPYKTWGYEVERRLLPQYKKVGRNDKCPCGSGKKYKFCIRDNKEKHYEDYYIFSI